MRIDKEAILNKTHYGLKIYAYILRQYYQGKTVLSLSGRDCNPTKNPFNEDKTTLMVKIVDNCAVHYDIDKAIASGDAFDFAALHFKLNRQELFEKLNEVLYLRLNQESNPFLQDEESFEIFEGEEEKPIPPAFSFFQKPISNINPTKTITLTEAYSLIQSDDYAESTNALRNIKDPKKARRFKAYNFDYTTFSGVFSKRNDKNLEEHAGLLTIDFDEIEKIAKLREILLNDQFFETELLFTSPSGNGLKWIIPIDLTEVSHQEYFIAVANYIQQTYDIGIDGSGKDVSRSCFLPHDPKVYINPKYL